MEQRPTVVVAGGAGCIGSHRVRMLAGSGYTPVIVDPLDTGHAEAAQGFQAEPTIGHAWQWEQRLQQAVGAP